MEEQYVIAGKKITRENFGAILVEMRIKGATELELYGCEFNMEDLYYAFQGGESFITALRIKEYINFINSTSLVLENTFFRKMTLYKNDINCITDIIKKNSTISELELGYGEGIAVASSKESFIKDDALADLLRFLETNQTIKNLKLVASFFNEQNANLLQRLLSSNKVLTDLDLSECNLDEPLLEKIRDGLSNNNSLTTLYLRCSNDNAAEIIAEILAQNRLKRLYVENSYFYTEEAKTILAAVKGTKLEYLSMGGANSDIDKGIDETLAETVRENQSLKYLSIGSIGGGTGGFSQFARSLAENDVLEELDFAYGNVGDSFLNALTKTNLRVLKLQDNDQLTADGLKSLIGRTTRLEELCVSSEELLNYSGNKLQLFKELAEKISTLKHIDTRCEVSTTEKLGDDLLTAEEQEELKNHIKRKRENTDQDHSTVKRLHVEEVEGQVSADSEIYSYGGNDQGSSFARTHFDRLRELKLQEQGGFVSRFG